MSTSPNISAAPSNTDKKLIMHVKIYGSFNIYVDEEAYSVSAVNLSGPFDVLPRHRNFITILEPCEIAVCTPYETKRIRIDNGVMHVHADKVTVFLDV